MRAIRYTALLLVFGCLVPAADGRPHQRTALVAQAPWILYASDWSGSSQIYAVDPSGRRPPGQLTFGRAPACLPGSPCGFEVPTPSPDGHRLLFSDYNVQGALPSLFVSRVDGGRRRRIGLLRSYPRESVWAPDSRRIAYTGRDGIGIANADGSSDRLVRRDDQDRAPAWSADGRWLALLNSDAGSDTLLVSRGQTLSTVATGESLDFRWSPVGDQLAYSSTEGLYVTRPGGRGARRLPVSVSGFAWAPDGRSIAFTDSSGVALVDIATSAVRRLATPSATALRWSPNGRRLAFVGTDGRLRVVVVANGSLRELGVTGGAGFAWSPDSRSLAYGVSTGATTYFGTAVDLRVTTLSGATRTVVAGSGRFGGAIRGFAWVRPPATVRYRRPTTRTLADVSKDRLVAPWPIERIAADGGRVAYVACGHVFVWTPSTRAVVQREATTSLSPACGGPSYYTSHKLFSLALAGDRVAYGTVYGGIGRVWWLGGTRDGRDAFTLGEGHSTNGPAYGDVVGELVGAGNLLVFSSWKEAFGPSPGTTAVTTAQEVRRVPLGCPCPTIASTPGPLVPFDVDEGRALAGGDNETWLLDQNGTRLLSIAASPQAAQLAGRDLVLAVRDELRHYDAATGALLHTWPLPAATGRECASPNSNRCYAQRSPLVLEDVARGLAVYVRDGQVHLLRLADGADAVVAAGSLARFVDSGLVYLDGARLQLVPFDRLPLR